MLKKKVAQPAPELQHASWVSDVWLVFLAFPILGVALASELSLPSKLVTLVALVAFGFCNAIGERSHAQNEWVGCARPSGGVDLKRALDPRETTLWFGLMIMLLAIAVIVGGAPALGATPYIVSYAVFSFRWRTTAVIFVGAMATVALVPAATGTLGEFWFLPVIVASVGGSTALLRVSIDRAVAYNDLQAELAMSQHRSRVARDVHDVLGHSLTAIVLKTQVTEALVSELERADGPDEPRELVAEVRGQLLEMQDLSRQALAEIRNTVTGLRMGDLSGEVTAARSLLDDAGVQLNVSGNIAEVPDDVAGVLGWVVREAVTNVARHADATSCSIDFAPDGALLAVTDNGPGSTGIREGNGLRGLRERLESHGLELVIRRTPGTHLAVVPAESSA